MHKLRYGFAVIALSLAWVAAAGAQTGTPKTQAQLDAEIIANLASGSGILAATLRQVLVDMVASSGGAFNNTTIPGDLVSISPNAALPLQDSGIGTAAVAVALPQGSFVVNGDMAIDQQREGGSVGSCPSTALIIDRWRCAFTDSWPITGQQLTDAPTGYSYSLSLTVGTGITINVGTSTQIRTFIDASSLQGLGWGAPGASSVVLDFCAKASLAGNYAAFIGNNAASRSYVQPYTVAQASTWQCYSNLIPGPTDATWQVSGNTPFVVGFDLGSGTNFQGTANVWNATNAKTVAGSIELVGNTGAVLQIAAVHLRPLANASLPYVARPYPQELELARRWYRKSFPQGTVVAQNAGLAGARCVRNPIAAGDPSIYLSFDPPMVASPTITTYNPSAANANWRDVTAAADVTVSVDPAVAIGATGVMLATSGTVATLGDTLCIHYQAVGAN